MDRVIFWRRTDTDGLERLELSEGDGGVQARATTVCVEDGGFELTHAWRLTPQWSAESLHVVKHGPAGRQELSVQRMGGGWTVDGLHRSDLDGASEPDLSITPLCNTFALRRLGDEIGAEITVDTVYVDASSMAVVRSRQRYVRTAPRRVRYVDLGTAAGFEADLEVDDDGLVNDYEHLFTRVQPGDSASG